MTTRPAGEIRPVSVIAGLAPPSGKVTESPEKKTSGPTPSFQFVATLISQLALAVPVQVSSLPAPKETVTPVALVFTIGVTR